MTNTSDKPKRQETRWKKYKKKNKVIFHLKERRTMGTLSLLKSSILEMKTKDL
jgi:hypothetical protein